MWLRLKDTPTTTRCDGPHLEQPGENVELKHWDVVVAGEVDGGLESHGLQAQADGVELMKSLAKCPPWHNGPAAHKYTNSKYTRADNLQT